MKSSIYLINAPLSWLKTPPLSIIYLKSYLESKKISSELIDLNKVTFDALPITQKQWLSLNTALENSFFFFIEKKYSCLLESVYKVAGKHDFIGLSLLGRNLHFSLNMAKKIKELYPDKKIVFGGPEVLFLQKQNKLASGYSWVLGEGEKSLWNIINTGAEEITCFNEIAELDTLPFPDFSSTGLYSSTVPLTASRGCPYKCNFCSERLLVRKFRYHSPEYIADLMEHAAGASGIRNFTFCDSLINFSNDWLKNLCQNIIEKKLGLTWQAQARINKDFEPGLARLLKKSGCYNLFVGLESGSDRVLKLMKKGFDSHTAQRFFSVLKDGGLQFEISLIFGYPGETDSDFKETISFISKNKKNIPKIAQVNPFTDYLGKPGEKSFSLKGKERVVSFMDTIARNHIPYTRSFINNLIYH